MVKTNEFEKISICNYRGIYRLWADFLLPDETGPK